MTRALVATAPLRLSLAGGGTDLPEWYERHGAHLLAVAVDLSVAVRQVDGTGDDEPLVRLAREQQPALGAMRVTADVSAGAGLGGSGAVAAALVALAAAVAGEAPAPLKIGLRAYDWERRLLGRPTGFQDQVCSAVGGCVEMTATPAGAVDAVRRESLEDDLDHLLAHAVVVAETGRRRDAAGVLGSLARSLIGAGAARGGPATVAEVVSAVSSRDGAALGEILRTHWAAKVRTTPEATWPAADAALAAAIEAGATGGKVVGAGGGGFVMCSGPARCRDDVAAALAAAGCVPVELRVARAGVRVTDVRAAEDGAGPNG